MPSPPPERHPLSRLRDSALVQLPKISDPRGNLTFVESRRDVPFEVRRAYWLYDVPGGTERGSGHAYRTTSEFIIALSGSFEVTVDDAGETTVFPLNRSYFGLHVPNMLWRRLDNFSTNAVCLVLCSSPYDAEDYVRDRGEFARLRAEGR